MTALLLAAGRSRRMLPGNKLLLRDAGGLTMVGRVAQACAASRAADLLVVTGHQGLLVEAAVREAVPDGKVRFVAAADYAAGLSASLRAGLAALPPGCDGVLVCLGDMPLVGHEEMDCIIAAFAPDRGRLVVVPCWDGKRGNPVLWGAACFEAMRRLQGDAGAKPLMERVAGDVHEVQAGGPAVLTDFDTPASLGRTAGVGGSTQAGGYTFL